MVKEKYFVLGQPAEKLNEPIKKGSLSFVLFESPFATVSTVGRGHPSLVSLVRMRKRQQEVLNFALSLSKKRNESLL
jgi:hypothetical protein